MSKPFFFRITAADYMRAVMAIPEAERGAWAVQLGLDILSGDSALAVTDFAKEVIEETNEFRAKKALAGRAGGLAKASSATASPSIPLASSSNSNNTETIEPKPSCRENKFSPDDMKAAKFIFSLILVLSPTHKKPNFDKWADDVRKMVNIDNRPHRELCETFKWAIEDESFWQGNCLSPNSLRKNYDQLRIKMKANGTGSSRQRPKQSATDYLKDF